MFDEEFILPASASDANSERSEEFVLPDLKGTKYQEEVYELSPRERYMYARKQDAEDAEVLKLYRHLLWRRGLTLAYNRASNGWLWKKLKKEEHVERYLRRKARKKLGYIVDIVK